ncbi:MAG: tRNA guanosine(15) transglycosylase TgtA [Thermogladius sp.]
MEYFDVREYDLAGRIGRLKTRHGTIETPYIFPVVDPVRQDVDLNTILEIGFNAIITNAYLFYKRNKGVVKDIHEELKWSNTIMTDSGGYQVLVYGDVEVDNPTIVSYQKGIGSDIAVILDVPTGTKMTWSEAYNAVEETWRRALQALPLIMDSDQLWALPIQGSPYPDLLKKSAVRAWRTPYHIFAFGSPTVLLEKYDYSPLLEYVGLVKRVLPPGKPIHVFGVGHPMIIPFLVALGADLFDSASYILYAREGRYMLPGGTKRVEELTYLPCNCPVCSRYTPKDLLELPSEERTRLIALHNLYTLKKELNTVKESIREGRLWELLEERSKTHPSLRRAFEVVKRHADILLRFNPVSKPDAPALLILDEDSYYNPRVRAIESKSSQLVEKVLVSDSIVLLVAAGKDFASLREYSLKRWGRDKVFIVHPVLGLFPIQLANTYPYFQHEEGVLDDLDNKVLEEVSAKVLELVKGKKIARAEIGVLENSSNVELRLARMIEDLLKGSSVEVRLNVLALGEAGAAH